ncbi:MAG: ABC transporter ATP-binding protein [Alphaproteobacteria bacterium]|nr:ABC transporter ATP-binding protein [Alphaproteobacteria bacterium]
MLKVENISKFFGKKQVLCDVSLQIEQGQTVALLGENGAGKSTLLRIMSGFFEANSGKVTFDDIDIRLKRTEFLHNIGYVQEISALYGEMSVYDFLNFAADIRQINSETKRRRFIDIIKNLQLSEVLTQKTETLSKGFKKRTELAAVLLAEPKVLLLDEPTEGLDPNQKAVLRKIIKDYARQHIVVISTHTLEDVDTLADRVLLLHKGKMQFDGSLSSFKETADNDLSASFQKATSV